VDDAIDSPVPAGSLRMYSDLAAWWPLISPVEGYTEEAQFVARLLRGAGAHDVLELGSGGGHMAFHLKADARLTLVDLSPAMLDVSRRLNPECAHLVGDMRTVRLDRTFDAVFVHDAVMYLTTDADLALAIATAAVHCRPGGMVLFVPDCTTETFEPSTDHGGVDGPDGRGVRYLEWSWDPDPSDDVAREEFSFLLRAADGTVTAVHETHHFGVFPRATWLRLLADAGLEASSVFEETTEDRTPRELFIGRKVGP